MKSFKEHLRTSLHPAFKKELEHAAHSFYQDAHPDLPRQGNYHYAAAVDHVGGMLSDKYLHHFKDNPSTAVDHFHKIAHSVVSRYSDNDTKESKANDRKREQAYQRSLKVKTPKAKKPPVEKKWDDYKPFSKARKGTGSY